MIDSGNGDARIALLLVEPIELLEEIYLCAGRRFYRIEPLQPGLEPEPLWAGVRGA